MVLHGKCDDQLATYEFLASEAGQCDNCYHHEDMPHHTVAECSETGHRVCMYCYMSYGYNESTINNILS